MALTPVEKNIRMCLERLRRQIRNGDDSEVLCWPLPGVLACSQRPLRDHPVYARCLRGQTPPPLPPEARPLVEAWVRKVIDEGIRSVICLLQPAQLDKYYGRGGLGLPGGGLIEYYELQGLVLRRRGMTDYQRPADDEMREVLQYFDQLPVPVLLHCSAGIDRTTPVAAFLVEQRGGVNRLANNGIQRVAPKHRR